MRILKLAFENLNSLKGSWAIDFTDPEYAKNHDIFVIHGPTGAGKTTLLDAITLALYGRTPRQQAVNNGEGGNELMTRGTGFCRAAVTYQCSKGVFLSEFVQKRAGMKPSGNLQKASFSITKLATADEAEKVLVTGTGSNLEKETQKIIQLDYKQFCRSIMLAQGEFSTFLKSESRDRAEILEKLTGTERYRLIGQKVAATFSDVKRAFADKKKEKESVESLILSAEDENAAVAKEADLSEKLTQTESVLAALQKELSFYDELERLESALATAADNVSRIEQAVADFAPQNARLELARVAKDCESAFVTLQGLRTAQNADAQRRKALSESIACAEQALLRASEQASLANEQLSSEETRLSELQPVWKQVRALDIQLTAARTAESEAAARNTECKNALSGLEEKRAALAASAEQLAQTAAGIEAYLAQYACDKTLSEAIAKADTLYTALSAHESDARESEEEAAALKGKLQSAENRLKEAQDELSALDAEIKQFVSADAVFIARLLQLQLTDGKPCPVCGSVYHALHAPSVASGPECTSEPIDEKKAYAVTEESAGLTARRDAVSARVQSLAAQVESLRTDCKNTDAKCADARRESKETLLKIQETLQPYLAVEAENAAAGTDAPSPVRAKDISRILSRLKQRAETWSQKEALSAQQETYLSANAAESRAVDDSLAAQKEALTKTSASYAEAAAVVRALTEERTALFGTKNVDEEEEATMAQIARLKDSAQKAEQAQHEQREARSALEAQASQLQQAIEARAPTLSEAETAFSSQCAQCGFADEAAFVSARMAPATFNALSEQQDALKTQCTQAQTSLQNATQSRDDFKAHAAYTRTKSEALADLASRTKERENLQNDVIQLRSELSANEQHKARAEQILQEYAACQQEYATWEQLAKWTGRADGADLSVFVQSLAFNSLLTLANKNLYGITGRYNIVQKAPASLDFAIKDIYFEEQRSVSNLSGGEQFLVSLSLALAISEFASRNVRVDSLFLDEGFGTLSGELLTEAINALKNLQKDGKMLGIITHVQDVINEIDQRIEVKPASGGYSKLTGAGIMQL